MFVHTPIIDWSKIILFFSIKKISSIAAADIFPLINNNYRVKFILDKVR